MPRKPAFSRKIKETIWELAALHGNQYELIAQEIDPLLVKSKPDLDEIEEEKHGRDETYSDWRTIKKAIKELQNLSIPLAATLPAHIRELRKDKDEIEQYLESQKYSADPQTRHTHRLLDQATVLRSCITNPQLPTLPYFGRPPLHHNGHDWRLDPTMWFHLTTPDLDDEELWASDLQSLKQHMRQSLFWEHLESLRQAVKETERRLESAAKELGTSDEGFRKSWQKLQEKKAWVTEPSRTPYSPVPEEIQPYYGAGYCDKVMNRLYEIDPELLEKQWEIERLLQSLWDDLLPDTIEPLITAGHCDNCVEPTVDENESSSDSETQTS